jgi:hypothetical protein
MITYRSENDPRRPTHPVSKSCNIPLAVDRTNKLLKHVAPANTPSARILQLIFAELSATPWAHSDSRTYTQALAPAGSTHSSWRSSEQTTWCASKRLPHLSVTLFGYCIPDAVTKGVPRSFEIARQVSRSERTADTGGANLQSLEITVGPQVGMRLHHQDKCFRDDESGLPKPCS